MMGGVAFTLLKAGCSWPKSAKQVEICLASLPKILGIAAPGAKFHRQGAKGRAIIPICGSFHTI
jgi:hypothetical protein